MSTIAIDCSRFPEAHKHKGHSVYLGGIRDGEVTHHTMWHPTDYPATKGTLKRHGQRSWYRRDPMAEADTIAVYRCVGVGDTLAEAEQHQAGG